MLKKINRFLMILILFTPVTTILAAPSKAVKSETPSAAMPLEKILDQIEARYSQMPVFSSNFTQTSNLKAMEITDTAEGHALFKRPGKMRWIYEKPERQQIITDGKNLWIYRPDDNQVTVGTFPAFFGDGKGASFLSDMRILRQKFDVTSEGRDKNGDFLLQLQPKEKNPDISEIHLTVSQHSFLIKEILTVNSYEDKTRITLSNITAKTDVNDKDFQFDIPKGTDIIQLNE